MKDPAVNDGELSTARELHSARGAADASAAVGGGGAGADGSGARGQADAAADTQRGPDLGLLMTQPGSGPRDHGRLQPGAALAGRYRIVDQIGDGASGTVYVAEVDAPVSGSESRPGPAPGTRVALKLIHRHLVRDEQVSRRFNREAKLLRKLHGEHLVPLLDHGRTEDGRFFIALELVQGPSLDELLRENLAPERVVDIICQLCTALELAHGRGIVHRDLKPGNVIVQQDEEGRDRVRVLDFGMAKILRLEGSDSVTALTEQNMVFGTPEYMAPEQARGDDIDHRADIYAAGVMLYELLTGSLPFQSNTPIGMMTAHLSEIVEAPSSRAPTRPIAPALEAVVLHALAKEPGDRYPSAIALATALRRALSNPADVESIAPPNSDGDLPVRDTALDMRPAPASGPEADEPRLTKPAAGPDEPVADGPAVQSADEDEPFPLTPGWIALGVAAAIIGVVIGLMFSVL